MSVSDRFSTFISHPTDVLPRLQSYLQIAIQGSMLRYVYIRNMCMYVPIECLNTCLFHRLKLVIPLGWLTTVTNLLWQVRTHNYTYGT